MAVVRTITADPGTGFRLTVVDHDPLRRTVWAAGELDLGAREELAQILRPREAGGRRIVQLDLSEVTFLDCSCLGVLVSSHHRLRRQHGVLVLTGVSGAAGRVVGLTGLDDTLIVVDADQDPFDSGPAARLAGHPEVPGQRPPIPTSVASSTPDADQPEAAGPVAVPGQSDAPDPRPPRARRQNWRPGKGLFLTEPPEPGPR